MDHRSIGEAMDDASGGSESQRATDGSKINRRSDGWCERWIRKLKKEQLMMQAMDQRAIEEVRDGASGGSARRSDGWCERWIKEQ